MNGIQGTKPAGIKCNKLIDAVVTIITYKKDKIDNAIFIKVFSGVTVSYITGVTADVLNTTNNDIASTELTRVLEKHFEMKLQGGSVLNYLNFRIC